MLDALYAVFQGHLDAPCGLCVGGDIAAHVLRLLHRRPDLLLTEMAVGSGLISLREHAAGGHDLDEIRSVAGVDAAGPPHLIHTVDDEGGAVCPLAGLQRELLIHVAVAADLRDDAPGAENTGDIQQPLGHSRPHQEHVAAQIPERRVALLAQLRHIPQRTGHAELRRHADPVHRRGAAPAHVDMGVDETRHDGAVLQLIHLGCRIVRQFTLPADHPDPVVLQHHGPFSLGAPPLPSSTRPFRTIMILLLSYPAV